MGNEEGALSSPYTLSLTRAFKRVLKGLSSEEDEWEKSRKRRKGIPSTLEESGRVVQRRYLPWVGASVRRSEQPASTEMRRESV